MKSRIWIIGFFALVIVSLAVAAILTIKVDPYFHYHAPNVTEYYYPLNNQRSQNDGILKNFDYEGLITGTSMAENFKTSEAEEIFGFSFIKVPYSGGTFKEMDDSLRVALSHNSRLKVIIRGLDMSMFFKEKDEMRSDLGKFPTYLYNDCPLDDAEYLFNRDILFSRVYPMIREKDTDGFQPGITSFDTYSNWMSDYTFGVKSLLPDGPDKTDRSVSQLPLTNDEKETIQQSIRQNVTDLAKDYPDTEFYYFIPPYSAVWWQIQINDGLFEKQTEAERILIEEVLKVSNIKLFSFNNMKEITTDINNYKDEFHYAEWINSLILKYMKEGKGILTESNYTEYLTDEKDYYRSLDYEECLADQEDYENDYYAAALLDKEITGFRPHPVSEDDIDKESIKNAYLCEDQHNGQFGVVCKGSIKRESDSEDPVSEYLWETGDYCGFRISLRDYKEYRYLVFYGRKVADHGQPGVYVYDSDGSEIGSIAETYPTIDNGWHQYVMELSSSEDASEIIFHGGYTDDTGSVDSEYIFSDFTFY